MPHLKSEEAAKYIGRAAKYIGRRVRRCSDNRNAEIVEVSLTNQWGLRFRLKWDDGRPRTWVTVSKTKMELYPAGNPIRSID